MSKETTAISSTTVKKLQKKKLVSMIAVMSSKSVGLLESMMKARLSSYVLFPQLPLKIN